jgi:hypothetical protein
MMNAESKAELHAIVERINSLITMDESEDAGNSRSFDAIEEHARIVRRRLDDAQEAIEALEVELSVLRKDMGL